MSKNQAVLPTLWKVIERLDEAKVPYMITGSLALNFYGHARATNDIDIVIQVNVTDLSKLLNLFRDDFYLSEDALKEALNTQGMFNVIDNKEVFKVDFILARNDLVSREQFARRKNIKVGNHVLSVISPEDLILNKLMWAKQGESDLQVRDVTHILTILKGKLDTNYLAERSRKLGVYDIYDKLK